MMRLSQIGVRDLVRRSEVRAGIEKEAPSSSANVVGVEEGRGSWVLVTECSGLLIGNTPGW